MLTELVPVTDVEEAARRCGETIIAAIKQLATRAEEIHAAVAASGVLGVRGLLKGRRARAGATGGGRFRGARRLGDGLS
jgi:hypothetical protein